MFSRCLLLLLLSGLLISCADRYSTPIISEFELHKEIVIQPGYSSGYIQDGRITAPANVNAYEPYCELISESESSANYRITINPVVFKITGMYENTSFGKEYNNNSGLKESVIYATDFLLSSESQPQIIKMACSHWEAVIKDSLITLNGINQILQTVGRVIE